MNILHQSKRNRAISGYSADFYRKHAHRYAEVAYQYLQSVYVSASHSDLKRDIDLMERLKELTPWQVWLGCWYCAGTHDVFCLCQDRYDMWSVDAIADRIQVHDRREPLP